MRLGRSSGFGGGLDWGKAKGDAARYKDWFQLGASRAEKLATKKLRDQRSYCSKHTTDE